MLHKSRFLQIVLAAIFLSGFFNMRGWAEPLKPIRFQLDWYPDAERGGFICALTKGFYKDAGLDVVIVPASPNVSLLSTLVFGNVDLCMWQSDNIMLARGQGVPVTSVMATMQHNPLALMVHADSPVKTFADLEGHSISIFPGSIWFQYIAQKYNLKNVRETRVNFGVSNFMIDPNYIQQVFVTSEPYACQKNHVPVRTLLISDTGYDPYRVVATTEKFLANNPSTVQAFVTASIKGWQTYLSDPTSTDQEIIRRNPQMSLDQLAFARNALIQGRFVTGASEKGEVLGRLDPARFAAQYKIMRNLNVLKQDFDFTKSYTTQFCNKNN